MNIQPHVNERTAKIRLKSQQPEWAQLLAGQPAEEAGGFVGYCAVVMKLGGEIKTRRLWSGVDFAQLHCCDNRVWNVEAGSVNDAK